MLTLTKRLNTLFPEGIDTSLYTLVLLIPAGIITYTFMIMGVIIHVWVIFSQVTFVREFLSKQTFVRKYMCSDRYFFG